MTQIPLPIAMPLPIAILIILLLILVYVAFTSKIIHKLILFVFATYGLWQFLNSYLISSRHICFSYQQLHISWALVISLGIILICFGNE